MRNRSMRRLGLTLITAVLAVGLAGCFASGTGTKQLGAENESTSAMPPAEGADKTQEIDPNISAELTLWVYYKGFDKLIPQFQKLYPNVKVTVKDFLYASYENEFLQALADGDVPDVMLVDSAQFGSFSSIKGVENLLDPPYNAGQYEKDFSEALWRSNMSLDRKRLVGFPLSSSPIVTYYRKDIMDKYGFPSEPKALGDYMADKDNWLNMAKTLKQDGIYLTQWDPEIVLNFERTQSFFDDELRFQRNNELFKEAIDIAKVIHDLNLAAHLDVWTSSGEEAVRKGSIAMMYMGTWGGDQIKAWAPESAGLWRETRLPFNLYGWQNSANFILPSDGKNKALAWKFIEFYVTEASKNGMAGSVPAYLPARGNPKELASVNPYMGNQPVYALHEELVNKMAELVPTPLDAKAAAIWDKMLAQGIERKMDTATMLDGIEERIVSSLATEIDILKRNLEESSP
ncbi:ABC transporter substrate-binding protein [Paenibacillus xanthanilyticus]|uniref:ABC transporter substrate-binding protein n=1 Tax=Paenibacillus xanthanilyticus TaxID=1783531 RepID=A0ABV8KBH1_9BACL